MYTRGKACQLHSDRSVRYPLCWEVPMARQPAAGVRDHILDTAAALFDAHGIHAVGLQQIIETYGCGKNLLYREFASKDDLIVAYLRRCQADWHQTVESALAGHESDPAGALVSL